MWDDLFAAIALMLVFEGILPFVNPSRWRTMMLIISTQSNKALRVMGLTSMVIGVVILFLVRGGGAYFSG